MRMFATKEIGPHEEHLIHPALTYIICIICYYIHDVYIYYYVRHPGRACGSETVERVVSAGFDDGVVYGETRPRGNPFGTIIICTRCTTVAILYVISCRHYRQVCII